jgi:hypothetical protein
VFVSDKKFTSQVARLILFCPLLPCRWVNPTVAETTLEIVLLKEHYLIFIVGSTEKVGSQTIRYSVIGFALLRPTVYSISNTFLSWLLFPVFLFH